MDLDQGSIHTRADELKLQDRRVTLWFRPFYKVSRGNTHLNNLITEIIDDLDIVCFFRQFINIIILET